MDTAGQWSPEASSLIQDANEGILSAKTELNAYWSGRAAESFNTYIDHISDTIDSTQGIMRNMAALMGDLRTTVDETYCKGLEFIKTCATGVLDAAGSAAQNWYTLWGAVCGAILEALSAFAAATIELLQEAIRTMGEYALTGRALGEEASQLHTPDPLPPNATQPGNWQVNPA
ncbi:hypothetical protein AHOG_17965 [Actinoalloteichus hoggarensis]|uniref:Proteins of 100 residues with WXG n=2 Tax=Actinoalloteichus hoggarensis TaxID=1470176 RepID=A0A221W5U9_9PSEU|nr:hypothetical protein AHOG_17965 [Actinoalloteichus hoggarensis]